MDDYIGNSVQSFTERFGLNWCSHHLDQALEELYGKNRDDIDLLLTMLADGTVEDIAALPVYYEQEIRQWQQAKRDTYPQPDALIDWALHTWMTALGRKQVVEKPRSPLPPPVIEARDITGEVPDSPIAARTSSAGRPPEVKEPVRDKEEEKEDIISLMNHSTTPVEQGAHHTDDTPRTSFATRSMLVSGAGVLLLAAALLIMFFTGEKKAALEQWENGEALEDSEWLVWLEKVEAGAFGKKLLLPGCGVVEKGKEIGGERTVQAEETVLYPQKYCTQYAREGMVYTAGRDMPEWEASLSDIEEQIGSPDRLNVDVKSEELRVLYQRSPQDIFLIFSTVDEQEELTYAEIGDINISREEPAALFDYPR